MLTPYGSAPCPVEGGGEVPQLLVEKILRYLGKFPLFRVQTERKICSSALLLPWLPPSKAPLAIGRSCVQYSSLRHNETKRFFAEKIEFPTSDPDVISFYSCVGNNSLDRCWPLTEALLVPKREVGKFHNSLSRKYCDTSENFHFFAFRPREKFVRQLFYYHDCPLQKHLWQLGGHVFNIHPYDIMKRNDFLLKNSNFRLEIRMQYILFQSGQ